MPPDILKFVGYMRVSTPGQGRSGLGLEAQQSAIADYIRRHGGADLAPGRYVEVETGKHDDRPELAKALRHCRQTGATLLVAKLDRLSRNAAFLMTLRDAGVSFEALDIPNANTLTLGVMALLAQQERELISSRTKAALEARRARGLPLGTPAVRAAREAAGKPPASLEPLLSAQRAAGVAGRALQTARAVHRARDILPMIEEARAAGCGSLRQIAAHLNAAGATTPRGCRWTAAAVSRTLKAGE